MKLKSWMKKNKYTYGKMAELLTSRADKIIHASHVYKWANDISVPRLGNLKIIQIVTHGKVTLNDFLD